VSGAVPTVVQAFARQLGGPERPVRVVQTHISIILLAGADAYKFKKPLQLDFLDFSTLAARRHFCEEELRLNQRTAPAIYLAVLPVLGPVEAPRLGRPECAEDADAALEWVLHMRRFDEHQVLDELEARGACNAGLIDPLAGCIARFHQGLLAEPRCTPPLPLGRPEGVRHWAQDNFQSLRTLADAPWQPEVAALAGWTEQRYAELLPLMRERHASGWVRECHGDLHLGNLALIDGLPVAFDAIEFNAELRWIDVISDLAFPVMDLLVRGRDRWAWRLLNGWLEQTGDFSGVALLPWYMVYRALVRAKIALIQAGQEPAEQQATLLARARAHLDLALRLSAVPAPRLVVVCGLSGSGKSTVAQTVAEQLGAVRLRSDVERKRLLGLTPLQRPVGDAAAGNTADAGVPAELLYSAQATERTYARLLNLAQGLLSAGVSVVVDAACLREHERRTLLDLAAPLRVPALLLRCTAPAEVLRQRVADRQQRNDDASDAGPAVLERQLAFEEALSAPELAQAWVLDTDMDRAALDAAVVAGLQRWVAG